MDLNHRPFAPQTNTLTGLRYIPTVDTNKNLLFRDK